MIIYMDGGQHDVKSRTPVNNINIISSWGMVAMADDTYVELHGARGLPLDGWKGFHETFAFIEAMLYAQPRVKSWAEVSFYTDDHCVVEAAFMLHPGNHVPLYDVDKFRGKLKRACKRYAEGTYEAALECLTTSRFNKVKGHSTSIYNLRVDYLSRVGYRNYATYVGVANAWGKDALQAIPFEEWLNGGFYDYRNTENIWVPAFAGPAPEGSVPSKM